MPFMAGRSARYEDNSACQTWMSVTSCKARLMAGNVALAAHHEVTPGREEIARCRELSLA